MNTYLAKQDLPGGIKKGDFVIWDKEIVKATDNLDCIAIVSYNPATEPNFFTKAIKPKYKKRDILYVVEEVAKKLKKFSGVNTPVTILSSSQFRDRVTYTVDTNGYAFIVAEKDLYVADTYWFVNSKGVVCSLPLTEQHKNSIEYKIRCYHNNAFLSKVEAQGHLNAIKIN